MLRKRAALDDMRMHSTIYFCVWRSRVYVIRLCVHFVKHTTVQMKKFETFPTEVGRAGRSAGREHQAAKLSRQGLMHIVEQTDNMDAAS